jgi:hypothetical protein
VIINWRLGQCDHDGLDWEDIAFIGALSESIAEEEKERERLKKEVKSEQENEDENSLDLKY